MRFHNEHLTSVPKDICCVKVSVPAVAVEPTAGVPQKAEQSAWLISIFLGEKKILEDRLQS